MNTENNTIEFDSVCDKVRYAVSAGEELTDKINEHLDDCEECRTFLKQLEIMQAELGKMGVETFTRNGKTLADSVMEEVERQKLFTSGKQLKSKNGFFRHMGLIAACAVIVVMALPVMNGIFGSKDAVLEDSYEEANFAPAAEGQLLTSGSAYDDGADTAEAQSDSVQIVVEESAAETEESDNKASGKLMFKTPPSLTGASNGTVEEITTEDYEIAVIDSEDEDSVVSQNTVNSEAEELTKAMPELFDDAAAEYGKDIAPSELQASHRYNFYESGEATTFDSIEAAALHGALMYCDSEETIVEESLELTYADSDTAYAVYSIENNGDITVYLQRTKEGFWVVVDVCDGDITE